MLRTITIGGFMSIQGTFVAALPDGRIQVRVGEKVYTGAPVTQAKAA